MKTDAFNFYATDTSENIQKQMDRMASRLIEMADTIRRNKEFASNCANPREQLAADLDALRSSVNDLHTNLMGNVGMMNSTSLMIDASKLLATKVED